MHRQFCSVLHWVLFLVLQPRFSCTGSFGTWRSSSSSTSFFVVFRSLSSPCSSRNRLLFLFPQLLNPLSPFDYDPFDTHTGWRSSRRQFARTHHNSTIFHVLFTCFGKFGVTSSLLHAFRTKTRYFFFAEFCEIFYFKLIAGEYSEKHVFYRVTNRFAVNLK
jgi:hypothetical protein